MAMKPFDIVLMVGIPGSGKTTRAKFFVDRDIPIFTSPDAAAWWSRFLRDA